MASKQTRKVESLQSGFHFIVVFIVLVGIGTLAQVPGSNRRLDVARRLTPNTNLFLPSVTYSSGGFEPSSIAVADLNGDGKFDAVVVNACAYNSSGNCGNGHGSVGVLLGLGDGTFQAAVEYDAGGVLPNSVAVADVNGDGRSDLLVSNFYNVAVLLGSGDGTFQSAVVYDSGGEFPVFVAVGDVNGDSKPDLVVAHLFAESNGDGSVAVLLGNGDGTFQAPVIYDAGGSYTMAVAIADVNGDGKPDLLVAGGTSGIVSVLSGNGDGSFQPAISFPSGGAYPDSLVIADVNHDGKLDVLVVNYWSSTLGVLLGNGNGTFRAAVTYRSGGASALKKMGLAVADVNGDGNLDLLVANECSTNCLDEAVVGVLLGNGDGTFRTAVTFQSGGYLADWVAVGDINDDGFPDVLVANKCSTNFNCEGTGESMGSVGVLLNNSGTRKVSTITTMTSSLNPSFVGQAITFTANVTSSSGFPPNGETITFYNGSTVLGTAPLGSGLAALTTSALPAGIFTITASYSGDSNFAASTSPRLRQVVNSTTKSATSTTLASSLNPSIYGQKITFTAAVATTGPLPPTGTVVFTWSIYTIGSATLNSSGVATLTKSNLNANPFPLTAVYKGDANNLGSTSPVLNQTVLQTTSAATISSSLNPSSVGQPVTFTAKISSPTVMPTGPVTFKAGTTVLGTVQLSGGKASYTTTSLPAGSTPIKVNFEGNSNIKGSSASITQVVQP